MAAVTSCTALAQGLPERTLEGRDRRHVSEDRAVIEPFVGVHTSEGLQEGLFPLRETGATTEPVRAAAAAFLELLTPAQLMRTHYAASSSEWRRWNNVASPGYARTGTPLEEMNAEQRDAAMALLSASLSARGVAQSQASMLTDQALRELNPDTAYFYSPGLYYFTIMGTPSATQPWGWQLDGHHLVITFFVLGDQVVMTPTFWGGEPAVSRQGSTAGNAVMQEQQDLGLALMLSLSPEQRATALLDSDKPGNTMLAGAGQDNLVLDYAGVRADALSGEQRAALVQLLDSYIRAMREPHAEITMAEIIDHLDQTHFSWIGGTGDADAFYYRIHSPVILIEFDHQLPGNAVGLSPPGIPTRDHIHTIVRTPNGNDYGQDLLRQHLERDHSNH